MRTHATFFAAVSMAVVVLLVGARDAKAGGLNGVVYTVDTVADDATLSACTAAANDCSLRAALVHSNADNDPTTVIQFVIGTGIKTITMAPALGPLPAITAPVTINGGTQVCSIAPDPPPCIRISGAALSNGDGLLVQSAGVNIKNLAIIFFGKGAGISFAAGGGGSVTRSFLGTADGMVSFGNLLGVLIQEGAGDVTIGGPSTVDRNLISGNLNYNVELDGDGAVLQSNYIGLKKDGQGGMSNNRVGIEILGSEGNFIGKDGIGNVISGNSLVGINMTNGLNNHIESNLIGTDPNGTAPVGNAVGIRVDAENNFIGGQQPGQGNVISGNTRASGNVLFPDGTGILVLRFANTIQGNRIGTNVAGDEAIPNTVGVQLGTIGQFAGAATTTMIGGDSAGARNVVSGNAEDGILITNANFTTISGNYVGTDVSGSALIPNKVGIVAQEAAAGTTIGGDISGERNVISGNTSQGIFLDHAADTVVSGNYIGLSASGVNAVPNGLGVLPIDSPNLVIGGDTAGERNVISGNNIGIAADDQDGMSVRGNYIGLNAAGNVAVPNTGWGVLFVPGDVDPSQSTNDNEISQNVISGNGIDGIAIQPATQGAVGNNNSIINNVIGLNAAGSSPIPNVGAGVEVGVPGQGITIGNTISQNSIDTNGGLGIDIQSTDQIPDPPVLSGAQASGNSTHVTGMLDSVSNQTITLEFFASPACDPSGSGEGRTFLAAKDVTTSGSGHAAIDVGLPTTPAGQVMTVTATAEDGSTSEFSGCVTVAAPTPSPTPTPSQPATPTTTPTAPAGKLGDADCDGDVDMDDVLADLSEVAGVDPGVCEDDRVDADCDDDVDAQDALRVAVFVAGISAPSAIGCRQVGT